MTFLRHAPRHVHQTVADYATAQLTALGWLTAGSVPFGLDPVTIIDVRPFVGSKLDNHIVPGVVTVTLGNEAAPIDEELGGPLASQDYPMFVDVFMELDSAALALAADLKDAFLGRHATSKRFIPVIDQATETPVPGWQIEFDDVEREAPEHPFALAWHSVHVTAHCYFQEVRY